MSTPPCTVRLAPIAVAVFATLALGGCGPKGAAPAPDATASQGAAARGQASDSARVNALAATLQACSYDGRPVTVEASQVQGPAPGECGTMVERIMQFTGLPANFVVTAGPVPNAAAMVLVDRGHIPRRVIAFNPDFMGTAQRLANGDAWGPISIMAHEIGHHLSGHTIVPGGSRPPIELEADKFSGYVLYKMGAPLAASTQMLRAMVDEQGDSTHPGRQARVDAVSQGWREACQQAGAQGCDSVDAAPSQAQTAPAQTPAQMPTRIVQTTRLPVPSQKDIPLKLDRFVIDETGLLDKTIVANMEQELYKAASDNGVEVALLVVKDLHGMNADDYAWAMMRQLRVGKLDVGNGAVLVVAPEQKQAGVAFGPGIQREMEHAEPKRTLQDWIDSAWSVCTKYGGCKGWTENLMMLPQNILRNTTDLPWQVRHESLGSFVEAYLHDFNARRDAAGGSATPSKEAGYDTLVRLRGRVVTLKTPVGIPGIKPEVLANSAIVRRGYIPVHVHSEDGYEAVLYFDPKTERLMPGGALRAGQDYTFVGRVQGPSPLKGQAQHLWGLSYDPL